MPIAPRQWDVTYQQRKYTTSNTKKLRDLDGQVYLIPGLFLQKGPIRVLLDPVAYDVPGAEGVVDLYLMPTYDDLASLYFEEGAWRIHYAFPPDPKETHSVIETKALPLSEQTVNDVLDSIAAHAEPSFWPARAYQRNHACSLDPGAGSGAPGEVPFVAA
jgi:hypothetical protein